MYMCLQYIVNRCLPWLLVIVMVVVLEVPLTEVKVTAITFSPALRSLTSILNLDTELAVVSGLQRFA